MKKFLVILFMLSSVALSAAPTGSTKDYSHRQSQAGASGDKWPMYLELEGKKGNFRNIARLSWMVPLWQDDTSMLFGDVRLMMDDKSDREGNIGLGYRHIVRDWDIASDGVVLGAYAFFDRKKSTLGNKYNQGTFGVEALGDYFRFSGNYYMPQNKKHHVATRFNPKIVRSGWNVSNDQLVFTYGTLLNQTDDVERTLKGYDVELRGKAPVTDTFNVWAGIGAYRFSRAGVHRNGPMAMVDLELLDGLGIDGSRASLGFEYRKDKGFKANRYGVLKLTTPLASVGKGKDYPSLMGVEYEMTRFVLRDIDVQTGIETKKVHTGGLLSSGKDSTGGSFALPDSFGISFIEVPTEMMASKIVAGDADTTLDDQWAHQIRISAIAETKGEGVAQFMGTNTLEADVGPSLLVFAKALSQLNGARADSSVNESVHAKYLSALKDQIIPNNPYAITVGAEDIGALRSLVIDSKTILEALTIHLKGSSNIGGNLLDISAFATFYEEAIALKNLGRQTFLGAEVDPVSLTLPPGVGLTLGTAYEVHADLFVAPEKMKPVLLNVPTAFDLGDSRLQLAFGSNLSGAVPGGALLELQGAGALVKTMNFLEMNFPDGESGISLPANASLFTNNQNNDGSFSALAMADLITAGELFQIKGSVPSFGTLVPVKVYEGDVDYFSANPGKLPIVYSSGGATSEPIALQLPTIEAIEAILPKIANNYIGSSISIGSGNSEVISSDSVEGQVTSIKNSAITAIQNRHLIGRDIHPDGIPELTGLTPWSAAALFKYMPIAIRELGAYNPGTLQLLNMLKNIAPTHQSVALSPVLMVSDLRSEDFNNLANYVYNTDLGFIDGLNAFRTNYPNAPSSTPVSKSPGDVDPSQTTILLYADILGTDDSKALDAFHQYQVVALASLANNYDQTASLGSYPIGKDGVSQAFENMRAHIQNPDEAVSMNNAMDHAVSTWLDIPHSEEKLAGMAYGSLKYAFDPVFNQPELRISNFAPYQQALAAMRYVAENNSLLLPDFLNNVRSLQAPDALKAGNMGVKTLIAEQTRDGIIAGAPFVLEALKVIPAVQMSKDGSFKMRTEEVTDVVLLAIDPVTQVDTKKTVPAVHSSLVAGNGGGKVDAVAMLAGKGYFMSNEIEKNHLTNLFLDMVGAKVDPNDSHVVGEGTTTVKDAITKISSLLNHLHKPSQ